MLIGRDAEAELLELLDYVHAQSPGNASRVAERIDMAIQRIAAHPEAHAAEPPAPAGRGLPAGAVARRTTVSGYTIRYLYPFLAGRAATVLVVSIRRGTREALSDPAYVLRWLEERRRAGVASSADE